MKFKIINLIIVSGFLTGFTDPVFSQAQPCEDVTLTSPGDDVSPGNVIEYQAPDFIEASNMIEAGASATYRSGTYIRLLPGFHAKSGSEFYASISDCDPCFDGIQNGEETGIDCGGPACIPCPCPVPDEWSPYLEDFESFLKNTKNGCIKTFDLSWYDWHNLPNGEDDTDWRVIKGNSPMSASGPTGSHSGPDQYLFLRGAGNACTGLTAEITGPCISLEGLSHPVFSFAYFMHNKNGATNGALHIDIIREGQVFEDVTGPFTGNQGDQWNEATIDLSDYAGSTIQFRFRGLTSSTNNANMPWTVLPYRKPALRPPSSDPVAGLPRGVKISRKTVRGKIISAYFPIPFKIRCLYN